MKRLLALALILAASQASADFAALADALVAVWNARTPAGPASAADDSEEVLF